jgi:hypothetical protein
MTCRVNGSGEAGGRCAISRRAGKLEYVVKVPMVDLVVARETSFWSKVPASVLGRGPSVVDELGRVFAIPQPRGALARRLDSNEINSATHA